MPGNVDAAALTVEQGAVSMRFSIEVDGKPFIPALYRQLAHWPVVLAWLADRTPSAVEARSPETATAPDLAAVTRTDAKLLKSFTSRAGFEPALPP